MTSSRGDLFGRVLGVLVLLAGLAVIFTVLWLAFQMFRDPNLGLAAASAPGKGLSATDIGVGFGLLIGRIALLFVGSICGSLIGNKGIKLYFAALPTTSLPTAESPVAELNRRDAEA